MCALFRNNLFDRKEYSDSDSDTDKEYDPEEESDLGESTSDSDSESDSDRSDQAGMIPNTVLDDQAEMIPDSAPAIDDNAPVEGVDGRGEAAAGAAEGADGDADAGGDAIAGGGGDDAGAGGDDDAGGADTDAAAGKASVLGKRKGRGTTTTFKKPDGPMFLQYNNLGQPIGRWRKNYSTHIGCCARKVNIRLTAKEIPRGLMQTFWDDTKASVY